MRFAAVAAVLIAAGAASATPPKSFDVATQVGRSNIRLRVILHPQADHCSPAQIATLRAKALAEGEKHMRASLKEVIAKAGTDASGPKEFFGLSYLAGCPADGGVWIAFPAQGQGKAVARFSPGDGWSPMAPL